MWRQQYGRQKTVPWNHISPGGHLVTALIGCVLFLLSCWLEIRWCKTDRVCCALPGTVIKGIKYTSYWGTKPTCVWHSGLSLTGSLREPAPQPETECSLPRSHSHLCSGHSVLHDILWLHSTDSEPWACISYWWPAPGGLCMVGLPSVLCVFYTWWTFLLSVGSYSQWLSLL